MIGSSSAGAQGGQLRHVAHRHPPLPAVAHRLLRDVAHVQMRRLVEEIDVEVGVHAELRGQPEDDVDLGVGVGVVVGAPAHQIGALLQRLRQQRLGPRRLQDALLGEGAELQIQRRRGINEDGCPIVRTVGLGVDVPWVSISANDF